jgi:hypothetical protein
MLVAPLAIWWKHARQQATRFALVALVAVSILVQIPGVLVDFSTAGIAAGQPSQYLRRDEWRWSPVWLNARFAATAVPANLRYVTGRDRPPVSDAGSLSDRLGFSLNLWWLYLFYLGILPLWAAMTTALALLAGAALLGLAAYRGTTGAFFSPPEP